MLGYFEDGDTLYSLLSLGIREASSILLGSEPIGDSHRVCSAYLTISEALAIALFDYPKADTMLTGDASFRFHIHPRQAGVDMGSTALATLFYLYQR